MRSRSAFTLVEVVLAVGVFAVTIVGILALIPPTTRSAADVDDYTRASALGDAIQTELERVRDQTETGNRLDAVQAIVQEEAPMKLVAAANGTRVFRESQAVAAGLLESEQYFLIEVREMPAPLSYTSGGAFLALTATIRWPYKHPNSPMGSDGADRTQTSSLMLNFALSP